MGLTTREKKYDIGKWLRKYNPLMELSHIGTNCSNPGCSLLDFLPFKCHWCHLVFCLEHRFPTRHQCTHFEKTTTVCKECQNLLCIDHLINDNTTPDDLMEKHLQSGCKLYVTNLGSESTPSCRIENCKERSPAMLFLCQQCQRHICVQHRHSPLHTCESLKAHSDESTNPRSLTSVKPSLTSSQPSSRKRKVNPVVELMKLKMKAKGDNGIPMESRLFFTVKDEKNQEQAMFFHKEVKVGKALDIIERHFRLNITNSNELKFQLVSDNQVVLPMSISLEEAVSQKMIVNGGLIYILSKSDN